MSDPALFRVQQGSVLKIAFATVGENDAMIENGNSFRLASAGGTRGIVAVDMGNGAWERPTGFWYWAPPDFVGTDTFTYINCPADDLRFSCSPPRTVTITVTPKPAPTVPTTAPEVVVTTTTTGPESSTTTTSGTSTSTTTSTTAPPPPPPQF